MSDNSQFCVWERVVVVKKCQLYHSENFLHAGIQGEP